MIKSLLYILPIHPDHEGIQLKVNGQLNAFENIVQTRCLFLSFSETTTTNREQRETTATTFCSQKIAEK